MYVGWDSGPEIGEWGAKRKTIKFLCKDSGTLETSKEERFNVENGFKGRGTDIWSDSNDCNESMFLSFIQERGGAGRDG